MDDALDPSGSLYHAARAAIASGDLAAGLSLLEESLEHDVHFKTLELIGEMRCRLGRPGEAIVPLAAATALNRGSRAPCLLAEAFLELGQWSDAHEAAAESLRRTPDYHRARARSNGRNARWLPPLRDEGSVAQRNWRDQTGCDECNPSHALPAPGGGDMKSNRSCEFAVY